MKRIERYEITPRPDGAEIRVKPSQRMVFSLFLAAILVGNGALLRLLSGETTAFAILLVAFGVCYGVVCFLPLINKARFIISDTLLVQEARFIPEGSRRWDLSEIQEVLVYETQGPLAKLAGHSHRIAIVDQMGDHFAGEFSLESDANARTLAEYLSDLIGVAVDVPSGEPPKRVAAHV